MSDLELSTRTKALLATARGDAPGSALKAKIWNEVGVRTGVGAPGGSSPGHAAGAPEGAVGTATSASAKMLAMGTLLGSAVTVGLALVMMKITPAPAEAPRISNALVVESVASPVLAMPPPAPSGGTAPYAPSANDLPEAPPDPSAPARRDAHPALRSKPRPAPRPVEVGDEDPLMQEASLVAEARAALARGDAEGALRSIRAARQTGSHQLVPEETSLETQALRAQRPR